ncbi:MAG: polysaccharide export protein [Bacteroides sp.]|nr:polysaccharide export protein [Bacteroides sp.]MDE5822021.1 polysaccharide biosynthesis/export family protein [Paramuribaculum sp.]
MKHTFLPIIIFLTIVASSCSSHKSHLTYLSGLPEAKEGKLNSTEYSIKIVPEDELEIVVTSTVPAATAEYNIPASNAQYSAGQNSIISTSEQQKYIVNKNGDIDFPVLGTIHVAGMSTTELKNYLTSRIEENVTDPKVKVRLINFKVNVMGEVRTPRTIDVKSERFSIFDALASAGDMTEYGRRDNVTVIRETPDGLVYHRLDLTNPDVIASPYYYLQQNDVVIVDPNSVRESNARYNTNNSYKLSVISTIVSAVSVIASLVIALAVR